MVKKTKKLTIKNIDGNEISEEEKTKLVKVLENKLQEIYGRNHAMTSEEQKEVEELKQHINELNNK